MLFRKATSMTCSKRVGKTTSGWEDGQDINGGQGVGGGRNDMKPGRVALGCPEGPAAGPRLSGGVLRQNKKPSDFSPRAALGVSPPGCAEPQFPPP